MHRLTDRQGKGLTKVPNSALYLLGTQLTLFKCVYRVFTSWLPSAIAVVVVVVVSLCCRCCYSCVCCCCSPFDNLLVRWAPEMSNQDYAILAKIDLILGALWMIDEVQIRQTTSWSSCLVWTKVYETVTSDRIADRRSSCVGAKWIDRETHT